MPQMMPAAQLPPFLLRNARLLPNRDDILPLLSRHAVIAEVGVMTGDFSKKILDICKPRLFYALDIFNVHELPEVWGGHRRKCLLIKPSRLFMNPALRKTSPAGR
ncbi:hypothetical protein [Acetobacter persici]|uniref:O-methyltransferase domain-containing protein n=1 Tax=Acetobacter persici TaxID=1076596 RepID=A0A1U9LCZ6_9PROT|nr:hypothetical protein [Acetobacter persici]AQT04323.1 hypothetical protein A0U91_04225 [Acetobacter persici]